MGEEIEFDEEQHEPVEAASSADFQDAVLFSSDWTVETILSQLRRENIQLNPNFQRREAWSTPRKSRFIESVIVGLPAPQLVLAEVKGQRGKYIVLDGKQRLLSLLRFTESAEDRSVGFGLSGMEIRSDLSRKKFFHLNTDILLQDDLDAFLNYTIRTVIIRNWPNNDFLHQVFLRLNTGSVKLSPQELRQAMAPGPFTTFADNFSADSSIIQSIFSRTTPDPRMRDVELLVRHTAFKLHLLDYRGRMKKFLDEVCERENENWANREDLVRRTAQEFEDGIAVLIGIFDQRVARKKNSKSFNRAIFDALIFYAAIPPVAGQLAAKRERVLAAYDEALGSEEFLDAVESDTAGMPNTVSRIKIWGQLIRPLLDQPLEVPILKDGKITMQEI